VRTFGQNLSRLQPDALQLVNWVIVRAADEVVGVDQDTLLQGCYDSSVVKTDVHYPTDANLVVGDTVLGGQGQAPERPWGDELAVPKLSAAPSHTVNVHSFVRRKVGERWTSTCSRGVASLGKGWAIT